jgi:Spy/CpxP family protein refolding chaperone
MEIMNIKKSGILAFSALVLFGASEANAQDDMRRQGRSFQRGADYETVMSLRERLELTDEQVASLDALRRGSVERRNVDRAEMEEMRSQLRAGQIRQSEMMAFLENRRDAAVDRTEDRRASLEGVLNETQLEALDNVRRRAGVAARRGARGIRNDRGSARGQGFRNSRGPRSGRGQGFRGERGPRGGQGEGFRGPRRPGGEGEVLPEAPPENGVVGSR